jgi:hypothetical protein
MSFTNMIKSFINNNAVGILFISLGIFFILSILLIVYNDVNNTLTLIGKIVLVICIPILITSIIAYVKPFETYDELIN